MGQCFKGEGPPQTPIKDSSYKGAGDKIAASSPRHTEEARVWRKRKIQRKAGEKYTWVWRRDPRAEETGAQGRRRRRVRKSQRGQRGREASQRGTGSFSRPRTQPQQTCLTLPAPGRWRGARISMNFSKPWVSPPPPFFLPLLSLPLHPCMRLTIHHVHIEKGFSCSLRMPCLTSNSMALFGEAPWEKEAGIYGGDVAVGKSLGFTGDMKQWMLNSSPNRRGIVTWREEGGTTLFMLSI